MVEFVNPAKVNVFWKLREEGLDSLALGTILQNPDQDQDDSVEGIQNVGILPPLPVNDSVFIDVFYQSESKAGKKRKIEWLDTNLTHDISQTGGIDATVEEVTLDSVDGLEVDDQLRIEEEIVQISQITGNLIRIHRGQHATEAVAHPNGTDVIRIECSVPFNSTILDGRVDLLPIPTGVTAVGSRGIITVRWHPYTGVNRKLLKHYNVWRSEFADPSVATLRDRTDSTDYVDNIPEGDSWEYWYWISATDTSGNETGKSTDIAFASAIVDTAPPDVPTTAGINLNAVANGMKLLFGVIATGQTQTIDEAKLRVKRLPDDDMGAEFLDLRTVAEGGAGPDADLMQFDNIYGSTYGARYSLTVEIPGRYFYTWALRNQLGWSGWTDGHTLAEGPSAVPRAHSINTKNIIDDGPAEGWVVTTIPGETINTVRVKATKPDINGKTLLYWSVQIKNTAIGSWRAVDENAGAAETYYDGSAISHTLDDGSTKLARTSGVGFGTAKVGDLILLDVRGGQFHRNHCQWGVIQGFETGLPATSTYIRLKGGFRPKAYTDLRIKVVKMPHTWNTEGYLGDLPGFGQSWDFIPNIDADEYVSQPIPIDVDIASIDARVWFENTYSRSDASGVSGPPTVSLNMVKVKSRRDNILPGPPLPFSVTTALGEFIGVWDDPVDGKATLDDAAIQYALDAGFTTGVKTAAGLGHVNRATGYDPGKTYYFRVAVHNQSGIPSHASTAAYLGTEGWGPWSAIFGPITSAADTGAPTDSVIPGPVEALTIVGANGKYTADWNDPLTGNLTIDDVAIQFADNPGFTVGAETAAGWGDVTHLESYAPGKNYYFRVAAHNQSGQPSHFSTASDPKLGLTGWGPWTPYGAPTSVPAGGVPGAPTDNVVPSAVLGLSVTGANGKYVAKWFDPSIGFATLDDTAIQWSTNASFSDSIPGSPATGWGRRNTLESVSPNTTFYFRIAVHNKSNADSDSSTTSLGPKGWGPWCAAVGPVSSSTIPIDPNQVQQDIVFNGGFELHTNGIPDGWEVVELGPGGAGPWSVSQQHEGKYGVVLQNGGTARYAIGSKLFPVRPGEELTFSVWALSGTPAQQGLFFRAFWYDNDALAGGTYTDIVGATDPPFAWTQYKQRLTVPPGKYFARAAIYNYAQGPIQNTNYHFDDVQVFRTIDGSDEIQPGTTPPSAWTGEARTDFTETFEDPNCLSVWDTTGTVYRAGGSQGVDGSFVCQFDGNSALYLNPVQAIPFDPRKLYRMTMRIRAVTFTTVGAKYLYCGVACLDDNKAGIGEVRGLYNNFNMYGVWPGYQWFEATFFFKGLGGTAWSGPFPDAADPGKLINGTKYFVPSLTVMYPDAPTGVGNICQVDDIRIESLDEQAYSPSGAPRPSAAPNGVFGFNTYKVNHPYPAGQGDAKTSAVNIWWDYTQGTVKAHQFAIYVSSGGIGWVERVRALPGTARHIFTIFGMTPTASHYISVTPEAVEYDGQVTGTPLVYAGGNLIPSAPAGADPGGGTEVGMMDWNGGSIWYDSVQYRNNIAPSTPVSASISIQFPKTGSGTNHVKIGDPIPLTYSQGQWIATHLAIYLKFPAGTINLGGDSVVALLPVANLPPVFELPQELASNGNYTVGIVAIAATRNGAQANGSFRQQTKNTEGVHIFAFNNPREIAIGDGGNPGETISIHRPLNLYDGFNHAGVLYASGTSNIILQSQSGKYMVFGPGASIGLGMIPEAGMEYGVYMANNTGGSSLPVGGGLLWVGGGHLFFGSSVLGTWVQIA